MKKDAVKLGIIVDAKSVEELKKPFQGKVEKIYENSALLEITDYDPVDKGTVSDLNNKMVVSFKNMKKAKKGSKTSTAATSKVKVEKIAVPKKKAPKKSSKK
ncbi:MAG: DUF2187 domain-containing protein [Lactobacillus sp.]|jgi:uncharacterized protein YkvS|nr:DUF2187 domain-containing protein [Lactobacillus sp.]MCH3905546.1 DUF2187 domain-containing protein [Lactobacillus sp.]MCI1884268.1 DUF2187 domain-containing protein [Lactobacillus sp.]MCI1916120.1 DUF2187 domain-containing protein [Lactobacillus sp.]